MTCLWPCMSPTISFASYSTISHSTSPSQQIAQLTQLLFHAYRAHSRFASTSEVAFYSFKCLRRFRSCLSYSQRQVPSKISATSSLQATKPFPTRPLTWLTVRSQLISLCSLSVKEFTKTCRQWATWHVSRVEICTTTQTTSITRVVSSLATSFTIVWLDAAPGKLSSEFAPQPDSIRLEHTETSWSNRKQMT